MQTKLEISCEPRMWSEMNQIEQFKCKLRFDDDPVFFWEDPRLGNMTLWPSQRELLREFYSKDENGKRKFKELLFAAGMRSGKTAIAALIILTELAKCLMMDSPQTHYDLLPKEEILFLATASTEKQCHRTIFKKVVAFIESSPFFCSYESGVSYTTGKLEFPKKLTVLGLGANLKANVGMTVKVFVAEEINFTGEETYKVSPKVLYNKLSKSTSTFKPYNEDIKVAISSQADGNDFLSQRIELTKKQKLMTTLICQKTSIEMNPHFNEQVLADEKLMDEESYSIDYGEGAMRSGSSYFKTITMDLFKKWNMPNIFQGIPKRGYNEPFTPDLRIDRLKYDRNAASYGIFADPASVGDGFGLSLAHMTINDEIIFDGITVFRPEKGHEIDPKMIKLMIDKLIQVVPVEVYQFDIYVYNEVRDQLRDLGIETKQHQLRLPDWEALKERVHTNRVNGPWLEYLEKEISDLKLIRGKVDHPPGGSKDMADSVCQAIAFWDDPKKEDTSADENQMLVMSSYK